jgi:hypothetical protein
MVTNKTLHQETRAGFRQLAILLAMLGPGLGVFLWGLSACSSSHRFGLPGCVGVLAGACLVASGGFYHYRTDYRRERGGRALVGFIATAAISVLAAFLFNSAFFR